MVLSFQAISINYQCYLLVNSYIFKYYIQIQLKLNIIETYLNI